MIEGFIFILLPYTIVFFYLELKIHRVDYPEDNFIDYFKYMFLNSDIR